MKHVFLCIFFFPGDFISVCYIWYFAPVLAQNLTRGLLHLFLLEPFLKVSSCIRELHVQCPLILISLKHLILYVYFKKTLSNLLIIFIFNMHFTVVSEAVFYKILIWFENIEILSTWAQFYQDLSLLVNLEIRGLNQRLITHYAEQSGA